MRITVIAATASAAIMAVAATAVAAPVPNAVNSVSGTCVVTKAGKMKAATTVKTTGSNLAPAFLDMTGCEAPVAIVKRIASTGIQKQFRAQGFLCTPSISGSTGKWKCVFNAADTPGTIRLSFTYTY